MRVSPVAYCYDGENQVLDAAAATAMPSHNHDEGIKGAQTVALAIYLAIKEYKKSNIISKEQILAILDECVKFSNYNINIKEEEVLNRFDETCQGTVPVALWIIGESNSFEDAIRKAVCLGADADTLGAIVGGIAEAIWGIPENLKKDVISLLPNEMVKVINEFYQLINNKIV
jgi:ADP-ribosylglycohydrolase